MPTRVGNGVKLSIYVPADLWKRATDLFPRDGGSELMQRALRCLLDELWRDIQPGDSFV